VKKSLDGYKPGQKSANRAAKPSAPRRTKKEKPPKPENSPHGNGATVQQRNRKSNDVNSAQDSAGKRKRTSTKRHKEHPEDEYDSGAEFRRPRSLNLKHIRREDSDAAIADTPMAVNLLADMANRRKKHAPPPVWELTSPRGIEGARQRTFNALMGSPPPVRRTPSIPRRPSEEDAAAADAVLRAVPDHLADDGTAEQYVSDDNILVDVRPTGAELLVDYPYAKRTVLHAYDSPITMVEMSDIINTDSLSAAAAKSSDAEVAALASMLPECDRDPSGVGEISEGMFSNPVFMSAIDNLQGLQAAGMFDREAPGVPPLVVDHYRRLRTETNLAETGWKNDTPLTGKRRRAALKRGAAQLDLARQSLPGGALEQPVDAPVTAADTSWLTADLPGPLTSDQSQHHQFPQHMSDVICPT